MTLYDEKLKYFTFQNPPQEIRDSWNLGKLPAMAAILLSEDP